MLRLPAPTKASGLERLPFFMPLPPGGWRLLGRCAAALALPAADGVVSRAVLRPALCAQLLWSGGDRESAHVCRVGCAERVQCRCVCSALADAVCIAVWRSVVLRGALQVCCAVQVLSSRSAAPTCRPSRRGAPLAGRRASSCTGLRCKVRASAVVRYRASLPLLRAVKSSPSRPPGALASGAAAPWAAGTVRHTALRCCKI
jgi:hypothetical protein